jgi:hypothetical protein
MGCIESVGHAPTQAPHATQNRFMIFERSGLTNIPTTRRWTNVEVSIPFPARS